MGPEEGGVVSKSYGTGEGSGEGVCTVSKAFVSSLWR